MPLTFAKAYDLVEWLAALTPEELDNPAPKEPLLELLYQRLDQGHVLRVAIQDNVADCTCVEKRDVNAALGLFEALLPDWRVHSMTQQPSIRGGEVTSDWVVLLQGPLDKWPSYKWASHRSPHLSNAILIAALRGLLEEMEDE